VQLPQLKRIRWAVRAALFLGVAASVAANVLHAQQNIISQVISAWPPLALLLTVELTSRIPMHKPLLAFVRVLATVAIAGIAAWVSYWHMQGVAVKYGETEASAFLLPISVDGLIVVASVSLVELAGRIRFFEEARDKPVPAAAPAVAPVQFVQPAPTAPVFQAPVQAPVQAAAIEAAELEELEEALEFDDAAEPLSVGGTVHGVRTPSAAPVSPAVGPAPRPRQRAATRAAASAPARAMVTETTAPKQGPRPVIETAELADAIIAMEPGITEEKLADRLNMTVSRLRAVRKEAENRRAAAARG
jgi:Protein of unknown function (DUF2637)